ncbi:MAG: Flp pilus assembly protein CpaB [Actinomycetota bacterium]|nr:Flp pilus assembly protein CpaB [Actinomycetota bacterium]
MRARGLIVAVAFLLAMSATMVVYLYMRGVEARSGTGGSLVSVIVADRDIPAGTQLDDLMADGAFSAERIPQDALVRGAVTDLADLKGRETSAAIVAGEQITTTRLRGSRQLPGGSLGIPDGFQALTLPLEAPRVAGGAVHQGDNVTIFGTFTNVASASGTAPASTVTLVPTVEVLKIDVPQAGGTNTTTYVTLSLRPRDAQKVVFAQEQGSVWMSLLPPDQKGAFGRPVNAVQLVR